MNIQYDETNTICRMQSQETNNTLHHTEYTLTFHESTWPKQAGNMPKQIIGISSE
jgi:hypothetical protein